jgi:lysophospholipase L1-like esterase
MKNILCFGDSNTYGLRPDGEGRFDRTTRYPGLLQQLLGTEFHIIEEGCPGRTTVFEDASRPHKKGLDYLVPCLISHSPLDLLILMLGTNDCKWVNHASESEIADGIRTLISLARETVPQTMKILIVSPIHLGNHVWQSCFDPEFNETSILVSKGLAAEYARIASETGCYFLDAASVAGASPVDEEHLDAEGHAAIAKLIANQVKELWN